MSKKKGFRGHYCYVCGRILANERFSGKGHAKHICKMCSKLPMEVKRENADLNKIYKLARFSNLSKENRKMLTKFVASGDTEKVRLEAKEMLECFSKAFIDESLMDESLMDEDEDDEAITETEYDYCFNGYDEMLYTEYCSEYLGMDTDELPF